MAKALVALMQRESGSFLDCEEKRKQPISNVQTAPVQHRWFDVAAQSGGFSRTSLINEIKETQRAKRFVVDLS